MPTRKTQGTEGGEGQVPPTEAPKEATRKATGASAARSSRAAGGTGSGKAAAKKPSAKRAAGGSPTGPDLQRALRDFAAARPNGWNHDDWTNFLQELESRGHNVNDRDQIGTMLERERLAVLLANVPGIGPQRVRSVADKFGSVWRLREASADEISREAGVPRPLAEKIHDALR